MMTSTQTTQNKMQLNCDVYTRGKQPTLDPRLPTLGHLFKREGYRTPYYGKWHLSHKDDRQQALIAYGFEDWTETDPLTGRVINCGEINGGGPRCGEDNDPVYARQASEWLLGPESGKGPWFLTCSLVNPHDICQYPGNYPEFKKRPMVHDRPPPNWNDDLKDKPKGHARWQFYSDLIYGRVAKNSETAWRKYLDFYAYCLEDMDKNLGTVLDALDRSGLRDNTIVAFISDHGEMGGSHGLRYKGYFAYEEEMNVPLAFSWPGRIDKGATTDALACGMDLMPTLLSLAGIHNPNYMAGVDLAPVIKDPKASVRDHVIFHADVDYLGPLDNIPLHIRCIRDHDWKYVYYFHPNKKNLVDYELYDLRDDPLEMKNLARDSGYVKKRNELHDRVMDEEQRLISEFEI
jgi:arylsulfatase A-like enzyme